MGLESGDVGTGGESPLGERMQRQRARRAGKSSAVYMIGAAAVAVIIIVGYAVAVYVGGALERASRAKMAGAQKLLVEGRFHESLKLASEIKASLAARPDSFSSDGKAILSRGVKDIESAVGFYDDARKLLEKVAEDPKGNRTRLEDLLRAAKEAHADKKRLIEELTAMAKKARDEESRIAAEKMRSILQAARSAVRIDPAAAAADEIKRAEDLLKEVSDSLSEQDRAEATAEISRLKALVDLAVQAKRASEANPDKPEERKKALDDLGGRVTGETEEDKAVKQEIKVFVGQAETQIAKNREEQTKELEEIAKLLASGDERVKYDVKEFDLEKLLIPLDVAGMKAVFDLQPSGGEWIVKIGSRSFKMDKRQAPKPAPAILWMAVSIAGGLDAMEGKDKPGEWQLSAAAPVPTAIQPNPPSMRMFFAGKIYNVTNRHDQREFFARAQRFGTTAQALTRAIEADTLSPENIRRVVAYGVGATWRGTKAGDYITIPFIREAVNAGYVEESMPLSKESLQSFLDAYRAAYAKLVEPMPAIEGACDDGSTLLANVTCEFPFERVLWRQFDKTANKTFFFVSHPDRKFTGFHVRAEFPGDKAEWADGDTPAKLSMVNRFVGEVADYEPETKKFSCDPMRWAVAARLDFNPGIDAYHGPAEWRFPPHVVLVDHSSTLLGVVTPHGKLDWPGLFSKIADPAARFKAQDEFLDKAAKVLTTPGELYFLFRYFVQYALDSPIETSPNLLGSAQHSGDIHQDYHQFLDRQVGGRFIGDCDDVAEFYQNVVERQGKLAFVLDVPSHATCGWVEKDADVTDFVRPITSADRAKKTSPFSMFFLDTGLPRCFPGDALDKVIEAGVKSYDEQNQTVFNPNDVVFLFRFAGEQTRTPYVLGTEMFVDRTYAETLERVQGHWHFHYYSLGIKTMLKLLETDPAPRNCFEVGALYSVVGEVDDGVKWLTTGMSRLPAENLVSRVGTRLRIAQAYWAGHRRDEAYNALVEGRKEIELFEAAAGGVRNAEQRFQLASGFLMVRKPWDAWALVSEETGRLANEGKLGRQEGRVLTEVYRSMREAMDSGAKPTDDEKASYDAVGGIAKRFLDSSLWERDDGFNSSLMKYMTLADYYAGRHGAKRLRDELLADGPYPDPRSMRNHAMRQLATEDEDWKWIRISLYAYQAEVGGLLDPDEPDRYDPDMAARLVDAMERASQSASKHGSLSSMEHFLLTARLMRAMIKGDVAAVEPVLQEVQRRNWGRLYEMSAEAMGSTARFMKPEDFTKAMALFSKYVGPKPHYFGLVYKALQAEAFEHARTAARVSVMRFPEDEDMKREAEYIETLIKKRLEGKRGGEAKKPPQEGAFLPLRAAYGLGVRGGAKAGAGGGLRGKGGEELLALMGLVLRHA